MEDDGRLKALEDALAICTQAINGLEAEVSSLAQAVTAIATEITEPRQPKPEQPSPSQ